MTLKSHALPAIAAAFLLLLPCTAAAQEDPEAVYGKFHRALIAGNIAELNKYGTPGGAGESSGASDTQGVRARPRRGQGTLRVQAGDVQRGHGTLPLKSAE